MTSARVMTAAVALAGHGVGVRGAGQCSPAFAVLPACACAVSVFLLLRLHHAGQKAILRLHHAGQKAILRLHHAGQKAIITSEPVSLL